MLSRGRPHRLVLLALFVPIARTAVWLAGRAIGMHTAEGIQIMDLGPQDEIRDAALAGVRSALRLLARGSPRTLARLRRRARFVSLAHGDVSVVYDMATGGVSISRSFVAAADPERAALLLGVGAAMASFRWANFRASPDTRAQIHRRVVREVRALADELAASYPALEWLDSWVGGLPLSPQANEDLAARHARSVDMPAWVLRLRRLLWD